MPTNVVGNWFTWQTHLPGYLAKKLSTQKVYLPLCPLLKRKKKQLTKKFFTLVLENHFTTQRKNFLYWPEKIITFPPKKKTSYKH